MNAEPAIEIKGLTKYYGAQAVVQNLHLSIPRGCVFGFLGRNGAGKTTTIRMLMGIVEPTRGTATILGQDTREWTPELRTRVGYLAEGHHVYEWMTVAQCGQFQRQFYPRWKEEIFQAVIQHFNLKPSQHAAGLSRGQRAGLCLAMTLAPEPELLVLDDPALGLDPVARISLLEAMIYVTRGTTRTILFSSHLLTDVERVADVIAVMDRGVLRAHCSIEEFRQRVRQFILHYTERPPSAPSWPNLLHSFRTDRDLTLTLANCPEEIAAQLDSLGAQSWEENALGLEEALVSYVGQRGEKSFFLHQLGEKI